MLRRFNTRYRRPILLSIVVICVVIDVVLFVPRTREAQPDLQAWLTMLSIRHAQRSQIDRLPAYDAERDLWVAEGHQISDLSEFVQPPVDPKLDIHGYGRFTELALGEDATLRQFYSATRSLA
jgi:hypothetical protein